MGAPCTGSSNRWACGEIELQFCSVFSCRGDTRRLVLVLDLVVWSIGFRRLGNFARSCEIFKIVAHCFMRIACWLEWDNHTFLFFSAMHLLSDALKSLEKLLKWAACLYARSQRVGRFFIIPSLCCEVNVI